MQICKRKSDGKLFEPSCEPGYNAACAMVDMLFRRNSFYFLEIEESKGPWYWPFTRFVRTGNIWRPQSGEFEVLDTDNVLVS